MRKFERLESCTIRDCIGSWSAASISSIRTSDLSGRFFLGAIADGPRALTVGGNETGRQVVVWTYSLDCESVDDVYGFLANNSGPAAFNQESRPFGTPRTGLFCRLCHSFAVASSYAV